MSNFCQGSTFLLPYDGLQLSGDGAVTPLPVQQEAPVVLQHRVGAAPDHHRPLVILADPHPLPVLDLRHNGRLGLGVVMPQDPGGAPVHLGRRDQHPATLGILRRARAVGRVVDPAVVLELQKPDGNKRKKN